MLVDFVHDASLPTHDICVVGGGPVGIALALACEAQGLSVVLLEAGLRDPDPVASQHHYDPQRHAPPHVASCRALGGTSHWWGGRCVPFDPIDFQSRTWAAGTDWPIPYAEVDRWTSHAARFFGCGEKFEAPPPAAWRDLGGARFDTLERWTPEINMAVRHDAHLKASERITVMLNASVSRLDLDEGGTRVARLVITNRAGVSTIDVKRTVLACGGVETTRLLLDLQQRAPNALGGADGPLGKGYMGHISGKIADIVLTNPADVEAHDFFLDGGVYARRRLTLNAEEQARHKLFNSAFWIDNPRFHDASHRSGVLSAAWLALAIPFIGRRLVSEGVRIAHAGPEPYAFGAHIGNILRSPIRTARESLHVLSQRFLSKPRRPGFLIHNAGGRYALHYHAEQLPIAASQLALAPSRGRQDEAAPLDIDFQYCEQDAASVLASHGRLDAELRKAGVGKLAYHFETPEERLEAVMRQASDGFHQIGLTRMARDSKAGVVDPHCKAFGLDNLYVAGSSVFPSSGQANPTMLAAAMAYRLAAHLAAARVE